MTSYEATCLLCLSISKKTININSDNGKELDIMGILLNHFWFQPDEMKTMSEDICRECWKKTETFHKFYHSIQVVHKKFETVFVKIEKDLDIEDDGEINQPVEMVELPPDNFIAEFLKIENIQDEEMREEEDESSDASVCEIQNTNSIDTETRATRAFEQLPARTKRKYIYTYKRFLEWKSGENIDKECFTEAVLLEYFHYLNSKYKPSSMWAYYSMLRTISQRYHKIDIYPEVTSLLKKIVIGFQSQKSNPFKPEEIQRFFAEAKNAEFLVEKVIMVFLMHGATSPDSMAKVNVNDVREQGSVCVIKFAENKENAIRSFTVENEYAACVRKYKQLRPENVPHNRFFLYYRKGKCTKQFIGKNKIRMAPKAIANFLKLKDADTYNCRSFRREIKKKTGAPNAEQINCENSTAASTTRSKDIDSATGENICEDGKTIEFDVLPEKSRVKYMSAYNNFIAWKTDKNIENDCFSEALMLDYFNYLKTKYKPTSLRTEYSKLRATIQKHHNCNIDYPSIKSFLKTSSFAYIPRRSTSFRPDEIQRFLSEAHDSEYLAVKVITIFGIHGVTSSDTLVKIDVNSVSEEGSVFFIKVLETRTDVFRSFTVENEYAEFVRKYIELRPDNVPHNRFFVNYTNEKCTAQPIGKVKFTNAPRDTANYLNLKNAENYNLHSFRKKSFKRYVPSSTVLDSYIEECCPKKAKIDDENTKERKFKISTGAMGSNSGSGTVMSSTIPSSFQPQTYQLPSMNTSMDDSFAIESFIPATTIHSSGVVIESTVPSNQNNEEESGPATPWDLLPGKSREKYIRSYDNFVTWKTDQQIDKECFSEEILMKYFKHLITTYKPSSLWAEYSKLKATILKNDNIDISFPELRSLLRKNAYGYLPRTCNVFRQDEIKRFLSEADDNDFLAMKVVMIFALYGATNGEELQKIVVNDVIEQGSAISLKIPDTKKNIYHSFILENEYATYVQKYKNLRPDNVEHDRFFVYYKNGKCNDQPIGKTKLVNTPKIIANFLELNDAENYTLHSFPKTSK